jgi:zinc protease
MKNYKIYILLMGLLFTQLSIAQTKKSQKKYTPKVVEAAPKVAVQTPKFDRSKLPVAAPAPLIKIGKAENFTLPNGLKVYVVKNTKLPKVAFNLVLDLDPIVEGEYAGLTSAVGSLLSTGTKNLTKEQFDEEVDFIGASINTSSTGVYASSLKKHTEKLMTLMADVILKPDFKQDELDKIKTQLKSGLLDAKENPNAIANKVASIALFGKNHAYGEQMTNQTIDNITIEACNNYFNKYFKSNIGYLAVVGDITADEAKILVTKHLGQWAAGNVPPSNITIPAEIPKTKVIIVDRPNAVQSIINIVNTANLKTGSQDVIKARITNDILGGGTARLFNNLREKHGYTYGAYSSLTSDKYVGRFSAGASVRNAVTDSSITEIMNELNEIRKNPPSEIEVSRTKNDLNGSFVFSLESPQTVANFAINTARYNLPNDYYTNYLKNIEQTSSNEIQAMAVKYIKPEHCYIIVVGKSAEIADKLKKFGEIEYYDADGNKTEAPIAPKPIDKSITKESVLEKYITAIGGKEKVMAITDVEMNYSGKVPNGGPAIMVMISKKGANKSLQEIKVAGNVSQKMTVNSGKANMMARGQKMELKGAELDQAIAKSGIIYEANPMQAGLKTSLEGVEKIDGIDCTKISFSIGDSNWTEYYQNTTGLKVRTLETKKGPNGMINIIIDYSDYKENNGVKFPNNLKQNMGGMVLDLSLESIKINKGIDDKVFSLD